MIRLISAGLLALLFAVWPVIRPSGVAAEVIWPAEGIDASSISSPFGPRLKASTGMNYDFHRGIDIAMQRGTPLVAIADGEVAIAGKHRTYRDDVVQLKHFKSREGDASCEVRGCYYSNYVHIERTAPGLAVGKKVKRGELVAYSGVGPLSGFPHLHFEIRDGGRWQKDAVHPLSYLPYQDTANLTLRVIEAELDRDANQIELAVRVIAPRSETDFTGVSAEVLDSADRVVVRHSFDMEAWNAAYTPKRAPNRHLDDRDFNGFTIHPARFSTRTPTYEIIFRFNALAIPVGASPHRVVIEAVDLGGNAVRHTVELE